MNDPYKIRVTTTTDEQEYLIYKAVYLEHGITITTTPHDVYPDTGYFFTYSQLVCLEW